jgi:tRNA A58 N-methylase Trm61
MEQAKKLQLEMQKSFTEVWSVESVIREYEAREFGFRPKHIGLTYTAKKAEKVRRTKVKHWSQKNFGLRFMTHLSVFIRNH